MEAGIRKMSKNVKRALTAVLSAALIICALTACGSDGKLPNGRYVPVDPSVAMVYQAIIIDGNNFTQVMPFTGMGITLKFTYSNGTITFTDGITGASVACEYYDGSLWYGGFEFKLEN
jgi:predicted small lipoprotein YifL